MESFFKNSSTGIAGRHAAKEATFESGKLPEKFVIKRRTLEESISAIGVLFFILGFCVQYWNAGTVVIVNVAAVISLDLVIVYLSYNEVLVVNQGNMLELRKGFFPFQSVFSIPLSAIKFVAVGNGKQFGKATNCHVVYLEHGNQKTPIRFFRSGRDAVMLVKSLKTFLGD